MPTSRQRKDKPYKTALNNKKQDATQNTVDLVIDAYINGVQSSPNSKLVTDSPEAMGVLNFFVRHVLLLEGLSSLFITQYVPAARRSANRFRQTSNASKYGAILQSSMTAADWNQDVYETVRLGYIGVRHKLENFVKELEKLPTSLQAYLNDPDEPDNTPYLELFNILRDEFQVPVKDFAGKFTPTINRIRVWCNSFKHNDGNVLPNDNDLFSLGLGYQAGQRINIEPEQLQDDIAYLKKYYLNVFTLVMLCVQYITTKSLANISSQKMLTEVLTQGVRLQILSQVQIVKYT
jgi:hypothetical protein